MIYLFGYIGTIVGANWAIQTFGLVPVGLGLLKRHRRGEVIRPADLRSELADVAIYLDLLAARLGIDLGEAVIEKFNAVSERPRVRSEVRL